MVFQIVQRTVPSWSQHPDYIEACRTIGHAGELGRYAVPRDSGQPPNRTDFQYGGSHWSPTNLPSIMYMLWPCQAWNDWKGSAKPGQKLDANGQLMFERHPRPGKAAREILDWPILKNINKISTEVEWWYIEILFRLEPRLTWRDIDMRMELTLDRRRVQKPAFINLLGMRCSRGREEWGLVTWSDQGDKSGERTRQSVYDRLKTEDVRANSTARITPGGAAFLPAALQHLAPAPSAPPANAAANTTQSPSAASSTSRSISNSGITVSDPSSPDYSSRRTRGQQRGHRIVRTAPESSQKLPSKTTASRTLRSTLPIKAKNTRSYSLGREDSPSPRRTKIQGLAREGVDEVDARTQTVESISGDKRRKLEPKVPEASGARRKIAGERRPRNIRRDSTESSQADDEPLRQRQSSRRHQKFGPYTTVNIYGSSPQARTHATQYPYEQPLTSFTNSARPNVSSFQGQIPEHRPSNYGATDRRQQQYGSMGMDGPETRNTYSDPQYQPNLSSNSAASHFYNGGNEYSLRSNPTIRLPVEHRYPEIDRSQAVTDPSMHFPGQGRGQAYSPYGLAPTTLPSNAHRNGFNNFGMPSGSVLGNALVSANATNLHANGPRPAETAAYPNMPFYQTLAEPSRHEIQGRDLTSPYPSDWPLSRHAGSNPYLQVNPYPTNEYGAGSCGSNSDAANQSAAPSYAPNHNEHTSSALPHPHYNNDLLGGASWHPLEIPNQQGFAPHSGSGGKPEHHSTNLDDLPSEEHGGDSGPAVGS